MLRFFARRFDSIRFLAVGSLLCAAGTSALLAAPREIPKKAAPKKIAKKSSKAKPAPAATGSVLEIDGGGLVVFKASLAKGTSNIASGSFSSAGPDEPRDLGSITSATGLANSNRTGSNLVAIIAAPQQAIGGGKRRQRMINITLAARGGFRAGQTLPISLPPSVYDKPKTALCLLGYGETELDAGQWKGKNRSWNAVSGIVRIDSISSKQLSFSVLNARCRVIGSQEDNANNYADGAFVLNGKGTFTIEKD